MKKTLILVALFLLCNIIGSTIGSLFYLFAGDLGLVDIASESFDAHAWQQHMAVNLFFTWAVCALFSFAAFFFTGKWRIFFLSMPIAAPVIQGLVMLALHA